MSSVRVEGSRKNLAEPHPFSITKCMSMTLVP